MDDLQERLVSDVGRVLKFLSRETAWGRPCLCGDNMAVGCSEDQELKGNQKWFLEFLSEGRWRSGLGKWKCELGWKDEREISKENCQDMVTTGVQEVEIPFSGTTLKDVDEHTQNLWEVGLSLQFSSVQFSCSVVSYSLWPHEPQHASPPCPSPTPGVHPNPCPSCWWCHPTISSSVVPFSSCPQSFPASGSFPMSQLFTSGDQSIGVSASASVLPMNTQVSALGTLSLSSGLVLGTKDPGHRLGKKLGLGAVWGVNKDRGSTHWKASG